MTDHTERVMRERKGKDPYSGRHPVNGRKGAWWKRLVRRAIRRAMRVIRDD